MLLRTRPRGRRILAGLFGGHQLPGVLAASEFEAIFHRECALVYRNPHSFSLVVFVSKERDERQLRRLARILGPRVRTGDVVGRLDSSRLVALLPYTDGPSAWQFADDLVRRMAEKELRFDCVVYTFPPVGEELPRAGTSKDEQDQSPSQGRSQGKATRSKAKSAPREESPEEQPALAHSEQSPAELGSARPAPAGPAPTTLAEVRQDSERPIEDMTDLMVYSTPLWKRGLDCLVAGAALILLSPVMLTVALLVKFSSPGPIIFKQMRAGAGGRPFPFYKFRSMYVDAEERKKDLAAQNEKDGPVFKMRNDPRVTPIGRIIRRYSLDELPQLYNVLKGDMTLVGPRPATMDEVPGYEPWQRQRLNLKGGITCTWQVSGRSEISFEDWMRMDARYVEQQSLLTDLGLLARTAKAVVTGHGAY